MSTQPPEQPTNKATILIVDDTPTNLSVLLDYLNAQNFRVLVARDGAGALKQVQYASPDLILLDVIMPGMDGFETCRSLKQDPATRDIPVIFMTALSDTHDKMRGFEAGAVDYVTKPLKYEEVLARVTTHLTLRRLHEELQHANARLEQRVAERTAELEQALSEVEELKNRLQEENIYLQEEIRLTHNFEEIIGQSTPMKKVLHRVEQVAATDATVLILGETGTGKELIARAIHNLSKRKHRPLVKVNCAALPANLIESELFGHEKGAFTGALTRKAGRFELADGGTIFLDEVGDLPLELQAKLLRVLQEGDFERLGGTTTLRVNVRVIAATNRELAKSVADKTFREDLYYRLDVFPILLPALRERLDDLPLLVRHFVGKYSKKFGRSIDTIPQRVMQALSANPWPGNVRELEHAIERALILSSGSTLTLDDHAERPKPNTGPNLLRLEDVEREHIVRVLNQTQWRIAGPQGAAVRLDLNPSTLRSRMLKLGIERPTEYA